MMLLFALILIAACITAFFSEKHALTAVLFIGFIQDPFRKIVAGEPIIFIVTVALVFGMLTLKQINQIGFSRASQPFVAWVEYLRQPLALFIVILILQYAHSLFRWGSVVVSTIGLASYVAPFIAIVVGYFSVSNLDQVRRFMKIYSVVGVFLAISVTLSFIGIELSIFKEVGVGLKIYDQGTILRSYSGFMRTGEIAAWHIATTACFAIVLYSTSKRKWPIILVILLVMFLMLTITFTGRRKMLMLVSLFAMLYLFGFFYFRKTLSVGKVFVSLGIIAVAWVSAQALIPESYNYDVQNYLSRGTSVYSDATQRFIDLGLKPIQWAYNRVGLFGGGLGIASQGAHLFQSSSIAGGSGEGGLGKVMVELGLPGLLVIMWLIFAIARYVVNCLKLASQSFVQPQLMVCVLGFAVLILVNIVTFSVASQLYGDMFILIILGLVSGFVFSLPNLVVNGMYTDIDNKS